MHCLVNVTIGAPAGHLVQNQTSSIQIWIFVLDGSTSNVLAIL